MTNKEREQVIQYFENLSLIQNEIFMKEGINMAIKALEQEPTTKNDKVDCEHTDCNNCVNHKYCDYESNKSENPTGSDDCISRADALALFCDKCGVYNCISKCLSYRAVKKMPSVIPIRPKGHWIEEFNDLEGEVRFTCSSCGKYQLFGTDFCYNCGSDNREIEE